MNVSTEHLLQQAHERFAVQDYYGTIHLVDEIIESGRRFADVYHLRGLALSLLGQPDRALEDFDRALGVNSRYIDALVHRGVILVELGRTAEADASFQRAAALGQVGANGFSRPVSGRLANLHATLGDAYAEVGAADDAIREYQRAVHLGPDFHDLRYRLARLLIESGRPLETREELERIVAVQPAFLDAQAALGLAHYLSGDATGAQEIWSRCLKQRPGHARVGAYLAMAQRLSLG
ncbi:MAG: tetratricopeptide repeat protein [Gemmatimonadetes bacterium]|nr:tetratricopeptide repeat protein [Gemmatimonadota bacterium]